VANVRKTIKVLIADDSAFMRKVLSDIINSDKQMEVIAVARNGEEACAKVVSYRPDVITLDIEMPIMDGLTTLEWIMENHPTPVIMLSALTQEGGVSTIKALEKGAVDFVAKPGGSISVISSELGQEIIEKIKVAAGITLRRAKTRKSIPETESEPVLYPRRTTASQIPPVTGFETRKSSLSLIAIGTSTGGPKALHTVMSNLKRLPHSAILIVQHMPPGFTKSLAQRLDSVSQYRVKEAQHDEIIEDGTAYVAPGGYHMEAADQMDRLKIILSEAPTVNGHRPSADVLMKSVAALKVKKMGVIMTGMGNDGAEGIMLMKDHGSINIGESAETCVVYGMPRVAAQLGALDYEVAVEKIAGVIEKEFKNL
jgi:two-component system chemotaxis response regulator CheB